MHNLNIAHGDLNTANVLVHIDDIGEPKVKILDFGYARIITGVVSACDFYSYCLANS